MKVHDNDEYQSLINEIDDLSHQAFNDEIFLSKVEYLEKIAEENQDSILKAVALYHRSDIPFKYAQFKECREYILQSLELCKEINFIFYLARCYNTLAIIDSEQSDFYSSFSNYIEAFRLVDSHPEYKMGAILLNNIGNLFVWLKEYQKALEYLIQSYHKYYEEDIDSDYIISIIVLNIVEEYSILNEYDNAIHWAKSDINFITEAKESIDLILTVNQLDLAYQRNDKKNIEKLITELRNIPFKEESFIYLLRPFLRALEYTIQAKDEKNARIIFEKTETMSKDGKINTFQYDYIEIKYKYYEAFQTQHDDGTMAKQLLKDYIEQSTHIVHQLRNTYTRRLVIETELLKVNEEKEAAINHTKQLLKDIELDNFTKILNKVSLEKYINEIVTDMDQDTKHAMFLIDIDHFKTINDVYGHERGDEIILQIVSTILSFSDENTLFGRFGGDEFILFIKDILLLDKIIKQADNLLNKIRQIQIEKERYVTISVGICVVNSATNFKSLFNKADEALYKAKDNGRNQYCIL